MPNRHLKLPQIKSLAARLSISIALGPTLLQQDPKDTKASEKVKKAKRNIVNTIVAAADQLDEHSGQLDHALKRLSDVAEKEILRRKGADFDELRKRIGRLTRVLGSVDCANCVGKEKRVCCGVAEIDEMNLSAGKCIAALHDLLACITEQARLVYADATTRSPVIKLSTESTHRHQDADLFSEFNISGFCDVMNDEALTSYVVLAIKEGTFDWVGMCGVPYIFAHEVVCHAFQSLESSERVVPDGKCLWSEAWMDRLAFELTKHWLEQTRLPKWLLTDALEVEDQASAIHKFRYAPRGSLPEEEADQLKSARDAFRLLRENWSTEAPLSRHRAARFSARLNASDATNEEREEVVILVRSLLGQSSEPYRSVAALHCCSDFLVGGTVPQFLENLRSIRDMPSEVILQLRQSWEAG